MTTAVIPALVVLALSGVERAKATKAEFDKLQGEWVLESITAWDGNKVVTRRERDYLITISKDQWAPKKPRGIGYFHVRLDPAKSPKHMDRWDHEPPGGPWGGPFTASSCGASTSWTGTP